MKYITMMTHSQEQKVLLILSQSTKNCGNNDNECIVVLATAEEAFHKAFLCREKN